MRIADVLGKLHHDEPCHIAVAKPDMDGLSSRDAHPDRADERVMQ
jgi:hypothetical protein